MRHLVAFPEGDVMALCEDHCRAALHNCVDAFLLGATGEPCEVCSTVTDIAGLLLEAHRAQAA